MLKTFKSRLILAVSALIGALVTAILISSYNLGIYTGGKGSEMIYGWPAVWTTLYQLGMTFVVVAALITAIVSVSMWVRRGV